MAVGHPHGAGKDETVGDAIPDETARLAEGLAEAGLGLVDARTRSDVYQAIGRFFARVLPDVFVVVSEIDLAVKSATIVRVVGANEAVLTTASSITGFEVLGKRTVVCEWYVPRYHERRLFRVAGGLFEWADGALPRAAASAIEKVFHVRSLHVIGLGDENTLHAVLTFISRSDAELPARAIESFAYLCHLALMRIDAQDELRVSEERQQKLFDNIGEGLALCEVVDADGPEPCLCYMKVNAAYAKLVGRQASELAGCTLREDASLDDGTLRDLMSVASSGMPLHSNVLCQLAGRLVDVFAYSPCAGQVAVIVADASERVAKEAELDVYRRDLEALVNERTQELSRANDELARATSAKSNFLANMSHELRTPLNSVIGFSGVLLQELPGPLNPEQTKQVTMISESGRQLLALVNDVLDLSKIEAGRTEVAESEFSTEELMNEVVMTLRPLAEAKGLALETRIAPGLERMTTDRGKVRQVLLNLLGNAVKFTDEGTVSVVVQQRDAATASVAVKDTGPGIGPEDRERVFERFVQINPERGVAKPKGTGLGLALSHDIAHMLGGDITLASEAGTGSEFSLVLPLGVFRGTHFGQTDGG